ncbi:hypothetical protein ACFP9V_23485 [Deinococcus radiopugnans]|uniref:Uncharacterized protein n=1 Tax=Deinococcus radiopugnans ATCC 19172 TaxID=585398 RepID=A0A5C4Y5Y7_9DEIO|nr:hypothetical protein [Deinococcus radiopugnans]MBB6017054.1 hypothetical protein [Deinococcus radiopugnans ATCC 19172]TNM70711.1 hypothetical protein FHR04_12490 [Deinococcus radiopugnans ATCC 19172]
MRLQTMYVDMRPMLTKWLGIVSTVLFSLLILLSLQPDLSRAAATVKRAYEQSHQGGSFSFGYLDHCFRSSGCLQTFLVTWSAPLPIKALLLGGLLFGVLSALLGLIWRPEVVAMRDTRVNAAKVEAAKLHSPTPPRRAL